MSSPEKVAGIDLKAALTNGCLTGGFLQSFYDLVNKKLFAKSAQVRIGDVDLMTGLYSFGSNAPRFDFKYKNGAYWEIYPSIETLLFPCHPHENHWSIVEVDVSDFERKVVRYYDSLQNYTARATQLQLMISAVQYFIHNYNKGKNEQKLLKEADFSFELVDSPQQTNSVDCGVFQAFVVFSRCFPIKPYAQENISSMRQFMVDCIRAGTITDDALVMTDS